MLEGRPGRGDCRSARTRWLSIATGSRPVRLPGSATDTQVPRYDNDEQQFEQIPDRCHCLSSSNFLDRSCKLDDRANYGTRSICEIAVMEHRYESVYYVACRAKHALCPAVESSQSSSISQHGFTNCQPYQILLDRGCEIAVAQLPLQRGVARGDRCGNNRRWLCRRVDRVLDQQSS